MTYQSSPMWTTQSLKPSTSTRRDEPAATSCVLSTVTSGTLRSFGVVTLDLLDHRLSQRTDELTYRQPVEHVVEEPQHDQSLRLFGRDATRLEVVQLVVVDRADRARVRALDVVRLDLEVRDRLRARALGQHQVAVRL